MATVYQPVPSVEFQFDSSGNPVINTDSPHTIRKLLHLTYLGLVACLAWNVIAAATLWLQDGLETTSLILPVAVFVVAVPAAYLSWYRQLNVVLADDKPKTFLFNGFYLFIYFQIVYCLFAAVAPPVTDNSITGFLSAVNVSADDHCLPGTFYWFGFGLFCVELALSISLMHKVFRVLEWPYPTEEENIVARQNRMKKSFYFLWLLSILYGAVAIIVLCI